MKTNNAEVITNRTSEDLKDIKQNAEMVVQSIETKAQEAEEEERSLELQLLEAQAAHEKKEVAEQKGKETGDKIGELS